MLRPSQSDWLVMVIKDHMAADHIDPSLMNMCDCVSFNGAQRLIKWMRSQGFAVNFWEIRNSNSVTDWNWGIDIADNCPILMEYILKRM